MGEDNLIVKPKFICALDGVGGWITSGDRVIDSGLMTKEYVKHIEDIYESGEYDDLKDLLEKSVKRISVGGSTTVVMSSISDSNSKDDIEMKTCNLGDSGFLLLRPNFSKNTNKIELTKIAKSES